MNFAREMYLGVISCDVLKYRLERGLVEAALYSSLLIILVSCTHPFRAVVVCISEGLVEARQRVALSHEDLRE